MRYSSVRSSCGAERLLMTFRARLPSRDLIADSIEAVRTHSVLDRILTRSTYLDPGRQVTLVR